MIYCCFGKLNSLLTQHENTICMWGHGYHYIPFFHPIIDYSLFMCHLNQLQFVFINYVTIAFSTFQSTCIIKVSCHFKSTQPNEFIGNHHVALITHQKHKLFTIIVRVQVDHHGIVKWYIVLLSNLHYWFFLLNIISHFQLWQQKTRLIDGSNPTQLFIGQILPTRFFHDHLSLFNFHKSMEHN